jgi:hypothetical protein
MHAALAVGIGGVHVPDLHAIPEADKLVCASVEWKRYRDGGCGVHVQLNAQHVAAQFNRYLFDGSARRQTGRRFRQPLFEFAEHVGAGNIGARIGWKESRDDEQDDRGLRDEPFDPYRQQRVGNNVTSDTAISNNSNSGLTTWMLRVSHGGDSTSPSVARR